MRAFLVELVYVRVSFPYVRFEAFGGGGNWKGSCTCRLYITEEKKIWSLYVRKKVVVL